jgi:hypothetical protein
MYNYSGASASYPTSGGGLWRKNRRNTGGGAGNIGVDLNRNYGIDWSNCSGASTSCGSSNKTKKILIMVPQHFLNRKHKPSGILYRAVVL